MWTVPIRHLSKLKKDLTRGTLHIKLVDFIKNPSALIFCFVSLIFEFVRHSAELIELIDWRQHTRANNRDPTSQYNCITSIVTSFVLAIFRFITTYKECLTQIAHTTVLLTVIYVTEICSRLH